MEIDRRDLMTGLATTAATGLIPSLPASAAANVVMREFKPRRYRGPPPALLSFTTSSAAHSCCGLVGAGGGLAPITDRKAPQIQVARNISA